LIVYRIAIQLSKAGIWLAAALGHPKARLAWRGRIGWLGRLMAAEETARKLGKTGPWLHLHCASLGEYEQGAPILAAWRRQHPHTPILLTFFSPSGVEGVGETDADHVDYLPFDTRGTMRRWSTALEISDTVLIKYELWPEMLRGLHDAGTRIHLVAARFDPGRHPLNWAGGFIRKHLKFLSTLQVQDAASAEAIARYGHTATVTGDPRVDRVTETVHGTASPAVRARLDRIESWKADRKLIVVGSAWPPEWSALLNALDDHPNWAILWAPHEINSRSAADWSAHGDTDTLSTWDERSTRPSGQRLILDEMGVLKYAYGLADFAVVGGGWGQGVHNVLEPAAFGVPVLCGPQVAGFREIAALSQCGGLQVCDREEDMQAACRSWIEAPDDRKRAGDSARSWVSQHVGATNRIAVTVQKAR